MPEDFEELLQEALEEATQRWTELYFQETQLWVPEVTGFLKSSGRIEKTEDGWAVVYDAHYANIVNDGRGKRGQKGYFKGRKYMENAYHNTKDFFELFLMEALQSRFDNVRMM